MISLKIALDPTYRPYYQTRVITFCLTGVRSGEHKRMASRRKVLLSMLADHPDGIMGAAMLAGMSHRDKRLMRQVLVRLAAEGVVTITRVSSREGFATALVQQVRPMTAEAASRICG